jgi:hypothetical protein
MRRSRPENDAERQVAREAMPGPVACESAVEGGVANGPSAPELRDLSESLLSIPLDWDDWDLDEDLRQAERLMHAAPRNEDNESQARSHPAPLIPAPPALVPRPAWKSRSGKPGMGYALGWLVLSFGLMPFVCGLVLVGWSYFTGGAQLWRIGVPLVLAGQTGWLIGLLLQLDGLWQNHRRASENLEELELRLNKLEESAALLSASHSGDARSFYAHFAEGAGPSLLLADLKGQLDLLAMQIARRKAA